MKEIEMNNKVRSSLLRVQSYFKIKKVKINENYENICQAVIDLLKSDGIVSEKILDENEKYMIKILKPNIIWKPEDNSIKEGK